MRVSYHGGYHLLKELGSAGLGAFGPPDPPGNWYLVTQILRLSVAKFRAATPRISLMGISKNSLCWRAVRISCVMA